MSSVQSGVGIQVIYISGEGRGDPPWKGSGDFGFGGKISFGRCVILCIKVRPQINYRLDTSNTFRTQD